MGKKATARGGTARAARKRPTVLRGYLLARDAKEYADRPGFAATWGKMKDNLLVLSDTEAKQVTFLNKELAAIAKKYEGCKVTITIEQDTGPVDGKLPDPDADFQGAERAKRVALNLFKIS